MKRVSTSEEAWKELKSATASAINILWLEGYRDAGDSLFNALKAVEGAADAEEDAI